MLWREESWVRGGETGGGEEESDSGEDRLEHRGGGEGENGGVEGEGNVAVTGGRGTGNTYLCHF